MTQESAQKSMASRAAVHVGIDAVVFDVGGTLVHEAAPGTPVDRLVAEVVGGEATVAGLRALARHVRLAAVTDTSVMREADVRRLLAPIGLDDLLDVVVTSVDAGAPKPDPSGVRLALGRLGAPPERALLVGDRAVDEGAAAAAGVHFVPVVADGPVAAVRRWVLAHEGPFAAAAAFVGAPDEGAAADAVARHDSLTKPRGSLGRLELLGVQLAAIAGVAPPPVPSPAAVAVFAGDHGVVAQGVTAWPQEVTAQMVANMAAGGAAVAVLARQLGARVTVVDVGVAADVGHLDGVVHANVRRGPREMTVEPAMTTEETRAALDAGGRDAADLVAAGARLLVTGEMGIGNTTPSAALVAAFTGRPPTEVTGSGTGVDDDMLARKVAVVAAALDRHAGAVANGPLPTLAALGGLEIAALAGFLVAGAAARVPVVVDGLIADAALLAAEALVPGTTAFCIAGHRSAEPGAAVALGHLRLEPVLDLGLRLGEGTGACLAVPVVEAAARVLREMATFDGAGVTDKTDVRATAPGGLEGAT